MLVTRLQLVEPVRRRDRQRAGGERQREPREAGAELARVVVAPAIPGAVQRGDRTGVVEPGADRAPLLHDLQRGAMLEYLERRSPDGGHQLAAAATLGGHYAARVDRERGLIARAPVHLGGLELTQRILHSDRERGGVAEGDQRRPRRLLDD